MMSAPDEPAGRYDCAEPCYIATNIARNCGWATFPCGIDKKPTRPERDGGQGYKDATTDPERIAELWHRWPGPLIGIATGTASGIDVLDIDTHETALAWWTVAAKRIPPTRAYHTRSGGRHIYFQHAPGVRNTGSKLAKGVDTRGDGGYVIYWFGAGYHFIDPAQPAPWPDWLLECVLWQPPPPSPQRTSPDYHDKAIEGVIRTVAATTEGSRNRNNVLYWGAKRLRERAQAGQIGQTEAAALLLAAAVSTGIPEIEARRTIASAWRA